MRILLLHRSTRNYPPTFVYVKFTVNFNQFFSREIAVYFIGLKSECVFYYCIGPLVIILPLLCMSNLQLILDSFSSW